jgi:outer membrane lipoprotein SlyB
MSNTVFLEPVSPGQKTVYFDLRSTADKNIDLKGMIAAIKNNLQSKGYKVVNNPLEATFFVQENILSVAKTDEKSAYSAVQSGFGGAVAGGLAGAAISGTGRGSAAGGLIGAAIGVAADALVDDVYYNMVTDLQIKQRLPEGQKVNYTQKANSASGSGSNLVQTRTGSSDWITYRTRIVSVANQVNLEFEEAQKELENKLVMTTVGIF